VGTSQEGQALRCCTHYVSLPPLTSPFAIPSEAFSTVGSEGEFSVTSQQAATGGWVWRALCLAWAERHVFPCRTQQLHMVAAWCTRVKGSQSRVEPDHSTLGGVFITTGR
jgi:hypothetical protein